MNQFIDRLTDKWVHAHIAAQFHESRWVPYERHNRGLNLDYTNFFIGGYAVATLLAIGLSGFLPVLSLVLAAIAITLFAADLIVIPYVNRRTLKITTKQQELLLEAFQVWSVERYGVEVPYELSKRVAWNSKNYFFNEAFEFDGEYYTLTFKNGTVYLTHPNAAQLVLIKSANGKRASLDRLFQKNLLRRAEREIELRPEIEEIYL